MDIMGSIIVGIMGIISIIMGMVIKGSRGMGYNQGMPPMPPMGMDQNQDQDINSRGMGSIGMDLDKGSRGIASNSSIGNVKGMGIMGSIPMGIVSNVKGIASRHHGQHGHGQQQRKRLHTIPSYHTYTGPCKNFSHTGACKNFKISLDIPN